MLFLKNCKYYNRLLTILLLIIFNLLISISANLHLNFTNHWLIFVEKLCSRNINRHNIWINVLSFVNFFTRRWLYLLLLFLLFLLLLLLFWFCAYLLLLYAFCALLNCLLKFENEIFKVWFFILKKKKVESIVLSFNSALP